MNLLLVGKAEDSFEILLCLDSWIGVVCLRLHILGAAGEIEDVIQNPFNICR